MAWIRTKIQVPKSLNPKDREKLAQDVILYIQENSLSGRDKNGEKFPGYSKDYADKKGVGRGDVDLVLSGEMLSSLELLSHKSGELVIGFDKGDKQLNGKAEGNIIGSYGGEPDESRARDFLGIDSDVLDILIGTLDEKPEPVTDADIEDIARQRAREIFGEIDFE